MTSRPRQTSGQIPEQWPSAWPSLGKRALFGAIVPLAAAAVSLIVIVIMQVFGTTWWIPLLCLLLAIWPLSIPARARNAIQKASEAKELLVTVATAGLLVRVPRKRLGMRPGAELPAVGNMRYYLEQ